MTDEAAGNRGTEPEGYVGIRDHGPARAGATRRLLSSAVWGGFAASVTSEHAMPCGYCGSEWPNSVCMGGDTHPGMDIGIERGTALYAAAGGTVEFAGWGEYYRPHHVDIRTPNGELHIYAHMWSVDPAVVVGVQVGPGQYLGTSGEQTVAGTMDPDGTGAHLHFETRAGNGCAFSPEALLAGAPVGGGTGTVPPPPPPTFDVRDRIRVVDGPLHLRSAPGLAGAVVDTLATGTELRVVGGPEQADGHAWYEVRQPRDSTRGWVAGQFCELVREGDR